MSSIRWSARVQHIALLAAAVVFTVGSASAQLSPSLDSSSAASPSATESSSNDHQLMADSGSADSAAPSPAAGGAAAGQYDNKGVAVQHGYRSRLAFIAGGGMNAPTEDSSAYITWGGNLTVGAGQHINSHLTLLAEYQFIDDKLPGRIIAETGATGGNAHIWSLTLDPVYDFNPKGHNSVYVTGGGGFYRKVTNFTDPQPTQYCTYYYCGIAYQNVTIGHFSSNQGGWNVGAGFAHRFGGMYADSKMQLFAEARYLDVLTPEVNSSPNGLGTTFIGSDTKVIPVTVGVRF
jgi:hypothetical protein